MDTSRINKLRGDTIPLSQQFGAQIGGIDYATNIWYPVSVNSSGQILTNATFTGVLEVNLDFADDGVAIGNSLGEADFDAGVVSAQTLRTVLSKATRTPEKATVIAGGTVAAGKQSVTFITDSAFTGTILGDTTSNNTVLTFSANGNDTLAALAYTVTAGSMQILTVT